MVISWQKAGWLRNITCESLLTPANPLIRVIVQGGAVEGWGWYYVYLSGTSLNPALTRGGTQRSIESSVLSQCPAVCVFVYFKEMTPAVSVCV